MVDIVTMTLSTCCSRSKIWRLLDHPRELNMRMSIAAHTSGPWRIRAIAPDFTIEDVWALPVHGTADEFPALVELFTGRGGDPQRADFLDSTVARFLWSARDRLGAMLDLGTLDAREDGANDLAIPGDTEASLASRLDDDLRNTADDLRFESVPFTALYRTDDEFAAEISNKTMHGILHLAWARRRDGIFQGQMTVYVKPRGQFGKAYMAFIKPFRYAIVYPALMRHLEKTWNAKFSVV